MTVESESTPIRRRACPSPLTVLVGVLVLVWLATFFIPAGRYEVDADGSPMPYTFASVPSPLDFADRVRELLLAPVNGLYGVLDPASGMVGPFNQGLVFGSVQVFLFILAVGGFMSLVFATEALDRGIDQPAYKFRASGPLLIVMLGMLFVLLTFAVSLPLVCLVGDGSAGTALVMPIFAPLGDFAGVDRALVLTA